MEYKEHSVDTDIQLIMSQGTREDVTNVIFKYQNRKLYSLKKREYLTLSQVLEEYKQDNELKVIDYSTRKDITDSTLIKAVTSSILSGDAALRADMLNKLMYVMYA